MALYIFILETICKKYKEVGVITAFNRILVLAKLNTVTHHIHLVNLK